MLCSLLSLAGLLLQPSFATCNCEQHRQQRHAITSYYTTEWQTCVTHAPNDSLYKMLPHRKSLEHPMCKDKGLRNTPNCPWDIHHSILSIMTWSHLPPLHPPPQMSMLPLPPPRRTFPHDVTFLLHLPFLLPSFSQVLLPL